MNAISRKQETVFFLLVATGLLIYNIIKAIQVPFYWDEIYTYIRYVRDGFVYFDHVEKPDANNHLLNTWLIQVSFAIFGKGEFAMRLPNLVACVAFIIYAGRFSRLFKPIFFRVCIFIILLFNPFVNDYFYLARGYGIANALLMAWAFHVYKFLSMPLNHRHGIYTNVFAALALLANFSLFNFFIIQGILILGIYVAVEKKENESLTGNAFRNLLFLSIPFVVLAPVIPVLLKLKTADALFAGGTTGFMADTVRTLINRFLYGNNALRGFEVWLEYGLVVVVLIVLITLAVHFKKIRSEKSLKLLAFAASLTGLCVAANIIQFHLSGIMYGVGRTAMYYYLLFSLLMISCFAFYHHRFRIVSFFSMGLVALLFLVNFGVNAEMSYAIYWRDEGDARMMLRKVMEHPMKKNPITGQLTIGMGKPFQDDLFFYREMQELKWLNYTSIEYARHPLNDYFFIPQSEVATLDKKSVQVVKYFDYSKSVLLENKLVWDMDTVIQLKNDFDSASGKRSKKFARSDRFAGIAGADDEYGDGFDLEINDSSLVMNPSIFRFNGFVHAPLPGGDCLVVVSFHRSDSTYAWYSWRLNDILTSNGDWPEFTAWTYLPYGIAIGDHIKCFVWNKSGEIVYFDDIEAMAVAFFEKSR